LDRARRGVKVGLIHPYLKDSVKDDSTLTKGQSRKFMVIEALAKKREKDLRRERKRFRRKRENWERRIEDRRSRTPKGRG